MKKHRFKVFLLGIIGIIIIIISLLLVQNPLDSHVKDHDVNYTVKGNDIYYTDDYAEIYKETFKAMFGDDYVISPPQTEYNEKCDCEGGGKKYYKCWQISYKDGNGNKQKFSFRNSMPLHFSIEQHAEQQVENFYMDYYNEAFKDIPLLQSSALYVFFSRLSYNRFDITEMCNAADKYLESIETPENCVKFCQLTEKNAFELMPIEMNIHIFINHDNLSSADITAYRQKAENAAMSFLSRLNEITNNTVNISFLIDDDTNADTRKFYIKGEEIQSNSFIFERDVFKSYEEKFYS